MRACSGCAGDYEDPERSFAWGEADGAGGEDEVEEDQREGERPWHSEIPAAGRSGRESRAERRSG